MCKTYGAQQVYRAHLNFLIHRKYQSSIKEETYIFRNKKINQAKLSSLKFTLRESGKFYLVSLPEVHTFGKTLTIKIKFVKNPMYNSVGIILAANDVCLSITKLSSSEDSFPNNLFSDVRNSGRVGNA